MLHADYVFLPSVASMMKCRNITLQFFVPVIFQLEAHSPSYMT